MEEFAKYGLYTQAELVVLASDELVRRALSGLSFKAIGNLLARRAPSLEAANVLLDALQGRTAEDWRIGYLFGCVGHELGYDAVCRILMSPALTSAGSWVGPALVRIDADRAGKDLARILSEAPTRAGREDAAWGLRVLKWRHGRSAMLDAALAGRVDRRFGAEMLVDLGIEPTTVMAWFSSGEVEKVCLALEVVCYGARQPKSADGCCWSYRERRRLVTRARKLIARGEIEPKPYQRRDLRYDARHSSMMWRLWEWARQLVRRPPERIVFTPGPALLR